MAWSNMQAEKETILLITNAIKKAGWIELPAKGNSMFPFIQEGDICRFILCEPSALRKGDIILFSSPTGQLIAHRLYRTLTNNNQIYYLFKGDSNLGFDELIRKEQIIGKLTCVQKRKANIYSGNLIASSYGRLILSFPILSHLLRIYVNKHRTI